MKTQNRREEEKNYQMFILEIKIEDRYALIAVVIVVVPLAGERFEATMNKIKKKTIEKKEKINWIKCTVFRVYLVKKQHKKHTHEKLHSHCSGTNQIIVFHYNCKFSSLLFEEEEKRKKSCRCVCNHFNIQAHMCREEES